jgi:hypothetical protein
VRFGHPYQPTEFGYGSPTHQFAGALPAVALDPTDNCARQLQRKQAPLLVAEALAVLHAQTGYWIPGAHVAITVTGSMLFVWNWGLNDISTESSLKSAWTNVVIKPIQADRRSAAHAGQWLRAGSPATLTSPVSRPRAALELLCASKLGAV